MTDVLLDFGQRDGKFLARETDGISLGSRPRGAADAMNIVG
jgi:hypothetical protein